MLKYFVHANRHGQGGDSTAPMNANYLRKAIRLSVEKMAENEDGPFDAVESLQEGRSVEEIHVPSNTRFNFHFHPAHASSSLMTSAS